MNLGRNILSGLTHYFSTTRPTILRPLCSSKCSFPSFYFEGYVCFTSPQSFTYFSSDLVMVPQRNRTEGPIKEGAKRIVWVDLEMTGLDIDKDHILEIACVVTDAQLNVVATGPNIIIHQPDSILNTMHAWCVAQHGEVL